MTTASSPLKRPDWAEPLVAPSAEGDDVGWLLTFSDLVLQLFAFVLVAAVCGGATRALQPAPAAPAPRTEVAALAAAPAPSTDAHDDHTLAVLAPASAWAADRDDDSRPDRDVDVPAGSDAPLVRAAPDAADAALVADDAVVPAADPLDAARAARLRALGGYLHAFVAARGDDDQASVTAGDGDVRLAFGGCLGFGPGSAELLPRGRALLREVQRIASGVPDIAIEVAGYTDDVPINTREFPSNLELSLARAARVAREIERGDPDLAVRTVALGFGAHHAIAPNDGPDNRARNRRVEVRLVDRGQSMP